MQQAHLVQKRVEEVKPKSQRHYETVCKGILEKSFVFALVGAFGGFFTGVSVLDSQPTEMQQQLIGELTAGGLFGVPPDIIVGAITAMQAVGMGLLFGWLYRKYG